MNDRVIAILLELHSEYEHGPVEYALLEEALGLMSPESLKAQRSLPLQDFHNSCGEGQA